MTQQDQKSDDFASQVSEGRNRNVVAELFDLLKENKKWWLLPIVFMMLTLGLLVLLGGTAAAPFIYTLF
jgi:hypothetical protein